MKVTFTVRKFKLPKMSIELMKNNDKYQVRSVHRAVLILKLFIHTDGLISLSEISRETGLNPVTAYRLISTLINDGFLDQSEESGKYRLGTTALALGEAYFRSNNLRQMAHSKLIELRNECGETVHLAILDGSQIVYLEKLQGLHPIGLMSSRVGGRAPAYCTAVGKILLAHKPEETIRAIYRDQDLIPRTSHTITNVDQLLVELSKIRTNGYALDQEENEYGVACVAAPIFDHKGIIAAVSLSGPADRIMRSIPKMSTVAMKIAGEISILLGSTFISQPTLPLSSTDY